MSVLERVKKSLGISEWLQVSLVDPATGVAPVAGGGSVVDTELPAARVAADNMAIVAAPDVNAVIMVYDGTNLDFARGDNAGNLRISLWNGSNNAIFGGNTGDGIALSGSGNRLLVVNHPTGHNGASWDFLRTPSIIKTVTVTASGDNALWTPTAGKKFRIMRYFVQITGNASLGGAAVLIVTLRDSTTDLLLTHSVFVPAVAGVAMGVDYTSGWIDLGNGKLSAVANNILNVNLSAALVTGACRVTVVGTEE